MSRRLRWSLCGTLLAVAGVLACSEPSEDVMAPEVVADLSDPPIVGPAKVAPGTLVTYTSSLYPVLEPDPSGCMLIASNDPYELTGMWGSACIAGSAPYTAHVRAYDSNGVLQASLQVRVGGP